MLKRREVLRGTLLGAAFAGLEVTALGQSTASNQPRQSSDSSAAAEAKWTRKGEIVVEHAVSGKPHAGKVLAAIQPHGDDIPLFAGGTVAKLIREGYTGYLIRTTNDEMTGGGTRGEGVLHNEQDNDAVAKALNLQKAYNLAYRNHRMDEMSPQDFRGNLLSSFACSRSIPSSPTITGDSTKKTPTTTSPAQSSNPPAGWRACPKTTPSKSTQGSNPTP